MMRVCMCRDSCGVLQFALQCVVQYVLQSVTVRGVVYTCGDGTCVLTYDSFICGTSE